MPNSASNNHCGAQPSVVSSVTCVGNLPLTTQSAFRIPCNWSEHTCPDGFKYYYNCITRESRVSFLSFLLILQITMTFLVYHTALL